MYTWHTKPRRKFSRVFWEPENYVFFSATGQSSRNPKKTPLVISSNGPKVRPGYYFEGDLVYWGQLGFWGLFTVDALK